MTVRILNGDCRTVLASLPDGSVHCVVTSPPYWGLRDYGVSGQIGLEQTPDEYVAEMVAVLREVRRVLREDGTLWLNLGDSYARNPAKGGSGPNGKHDFIPGYGNARRIMSESKGSSDGAAGRGDRAPIRNGGNGLKEKDLVGIPWMVAFALRADGWWLRSDIIWAKPNPMPESVTDRPTTTHEHVFLLSKSDRYFYDAEAVREPAQSGPSDLKKMAESLPRIGGKHKTLEDPLSKASAATNIGQRRSVGGRALKQDGHDEAEDGGATLAGRNLRNVWTIATSPFPGAHFATFPPELAERCIKAGTSEKGCCAACAAPWRRVVERVDQGYDGSRYGERVVAASGGAKSGGTERSTLGSSNGKLVGHQSTVGWQPTCSCSEQMSAAAKAGAIVPCTVLDPFAGAFTTAMVADRLRRSAIGIELNPEYCAMAERRLIGDAGMFAEIAAQ